MAIETLDKSAAWEGVIRNIRAAYLAGATAGGPSKDLAVRSVILEAFQGELLKVIEYMDPASVQFVVAAMKKAAEIGLSHARACNSSLHMR